MSVDYYVSTSTYGYTPRGAKIDLDADYVVHDHGGEGVRAFYGEEDLPAEGTITDLVQRIEHVRDLRVRSLFELRPGDVVRRVNLHPYMQHYPFVTEPLTVVSYNVAAPVTDIEVNFAGSDVFKSGFATDLGLLPYDSGWWNPQNFVVGDVVWTESHPDFEIYLRLKKKFGEGY